MGSPILFLALFITSVVGKLIDDLPSKNCIEITYGGFLKKLYVRHEVTFLNEHFMKHKRGLEKVPMHYNPCYDAPQPYVMNRDFSGFYFTKEQFAATRHNETTDELNMIINNVPRMLARCKGPWDTNMRKVQADDVDAETLTDMSD
ncbi:hypothetical protein Pmar_PMAR010116 [Perkinsus marinus ATCC 50983]|uniref:Uncharacterized protein n=1 Tax=Perkinsus marinus (strain ATCC 50983 / TXsc) TaxID=423536 RepID=C5K4W1_PERM5|nr:hypothetical protein Pmar_PMAR010116 [Perkinsus marinus ATCC 50983]EER20383.1 hypothetical protein Pmar_PMAR010116 [Perkinsus marinus ATCC 50983]|eukprot:XP_002788587.1 hypothetical protein Pmar_PMAR010116 [Perkinsus marinus ATCC 50983]